MRSWGRKRGGRWSWWSRWTNTSSTISATSQKFSPPWTYTPPFSNISAKSETSSSTPKIVYFYWARMWTNRKKLLSPSSSAPTTTKESSSLLRPNQIRMHTYRICCNKWAPSTSITSSPKYFRTLKIRLNVLSRNSCWVDPLRKTPATACPWVTLRLSTVSLSVAPSSATSGCGANGTETSTNNSSISYK